MIPVSWSERRLHHWIQRLRASEPEARFVVGSKRHDAAVLAKDARRTALCTDQVAEGVHAALGTSGGLLGRKAVDRVLSDLAAVGARPRAIELAVAAAADESERRLRDVIRAARKRARSFGAELVGGDLACVPGPLRISATACGVLDYDGPPPSRERARAGQLVLLSGPVGGSRRGRHLALEPRVELGERLARAGVAALMDTTDGLGLDLVRLAECSSVRIVVSELPIHQDAFHLARTSGRSAQDHALEDGEDHELIATATPRVYAALRRSAAGRRLHVIGRVERGKGLWLALDGQTARPFRGGGYVHGSA